MGQKGLLGKKKMKEEKGVKREKEKEKEIKISEKFSLNSYAIRSYITNIITCFSIIVILGIYLLYYYSIIIDTTIIF